MEFGPRETRVKTGRLDDGRIRVVLEHTRVKVSAEGVAEHYDDAKAIAEKALKAKVTELVTLVVGSTAAAS